MVAAFPQGNSQGEKPGLSPLSASPNLLRAEHFYPGSSSQQKLLILVGCL